MRPMRGSRVLEKDPAMARILTPDGQQTASRNNCHVSTFFHYQRAAPLSLIALEALNVMKEGHDGSGVGLYMTDLGGEFAGYKHCPILSGIFTKEGMKKLNEYMTARGFVAKHEVVIRPSKIRLRAPRGATPTCSASTNTPPSGWASARRRGLCDS